MTPAASITDALITIIAPHDSGTMKQLPVSGFLTAGIYFVADKKSLVC